MTLEEQAIEEKRRLLNLIDEIPTKKVAALMPVIENTAWMKAKLDEARELIKDSPVVVKYNNGGGQKGIRENPLFKGYEALWKAYLLGLDRIMQMLPADEFARRPVVPEENRPQNVLEMVRAKHKKEA